MTDTVSREVRSRMMAGIGGSNTRPEIIVRQVLHRNGFRFRLHRKDLPGRPDIVLPRYKTAIFVNGCFWHVHGCRLSKLPAGNASFWRDKLAGNRVRDAKVNQKLLQMGWRVVTVWECATRGSQAASRFDDAMVTLCDWIRFRPEETTFEILDIPVNQE